MENTENCDKLGDNEPCAKKIIDVKNGLFLDSDCLRQILLHDSIKDKRVCVISIAGAFRQGKSFLLNFFIRYLTVTCNGKRDLTKWLTAEDGPIAGFSSKGGSKTITIGILIWSEIFISRLPSGEEIAVILMDTQGSFDNETTLKSCAAVFALSTLISSVQIYNLKDNIKSSDLTHLQFFLEYGRLLRDSGDAAPFQNLLFLIRDWATPEEHPYGMEGGNTLMDSVLDTDDEDVSPEIISVRKGIKELFSHIDCFLLPHPGLEVTKLEFNGELEDIKENFLKYTEILASTVLSPNNLVPKVINGEYVKVKHIVGLFENYCQQFKGKDLPEVESLFTVTANIQQKMALEEAEAVYEKEMAFVKDESSKAVEENLLLEEHKRCKLLAVDHFNQKKLIGSQEMKKKYLMKLEDFLELKFTEYDYINIGKLRKEQDAEMQRKFLEQQRKISSLEEKVANEAQMRRTMMEKHEAFAEEHKEKIAALRRELDAEKDKCVIL